MNKAVLRWAAERSGKSIDDLSKKPQMKMIQKWMKGDERPTIKQLEAFSNATYVPLGYMFFSRPPDEKISIPHFRTYADSSVSNPSANLIDTIQIIEQRQDWIREYLIADGKEPLEFVGSAELTDLPKKTARKIRDELDIGEEWASMHTNWSNALSEMKKRIENIGIFLTVSGYVRTDSRYRPLDPEEFRGFVLVDDYAPFIFVNSKDFKAAQMFTLAHELAHVWIGRSAAFDLQDLGPAGNNTEKTCNQIAAEFLVPIEIMKQEWDRFNKELEPFEAGARHFKVSEIAVARRALDAGIITSDQFREFYTKLQRDKEDKFRKMAKVTQNDGPHGNFYNTAHVRIGKTFMRNIINAVKEGKLFYREAYSLTGLNRKTFDGMIAHVGREKSMHVA